MLADPGLVVCAAAHTACGPGRDKAGASRKGEGL